MLDQITEIMIETAAKALEKYRTTDFGWDDDEFDTWWNLDSRCGCNRRKEEARVVLEAAFSII